MGFLSNQFARPAQIQQTGQQQQMMQPAVGMPQQQEPMAYGQAITQGPGGQMYTDTSMQTPYNPPQQIGPIRGQATGFDGNPIRNFGPQRGIGSFPNPFGNRGGFGNPYGGSRGGFGQPPQFGGGMYGGGFGMQRPPQFGGGYGMQQPGFGGGFNRPPMFGGGFGGGYGMQPPQFGGGYGGGYGGGMGGGFGFGGGGYRRMPPMFGGGNPFGPGFGGGIGGMFPGMGGGYGQRPPMYGGGGFGGGFRQQPPSFGGIGGGGFSQPMPQPIRPQPMPIGGLRPPKRPMPMPIDGPRPVFNRGPGSMGRNEIHIARPPKQYLNLKPRPAPMMQTQGPESMMFSRLG